PMVSAAAAWVWTVRPSLDNTQLFDVMRFSTHDIDAPGYDRATGFGLLNIPSALAYTPPVRDPLEPNDDIDQVATTGIFDGGEPAVLTPKRHTVTFTARVDRHEDPHDVYRAFVPAHGTLAARAGGGGVDLRIFRSGARDIGAKAAAISQRAGVAPDVAAVRNTGKRVEPVGERRLGDIEIDVVQERLAELSFLVGCAVPSEDLEGVQLDGDHAPASAAATVSASTCSRTSCARMIVAPRSYAATAAAMLADSGPVVALESPRMRPSELFREKPMTTGRPSEVRTSSLRTSSKL